MLIYNKHMSIGSNIKKRRYELNMSQQDLANALGYKTRSTIAKIESEENSISIKKLRDFAIVLDTTVEALIGDNTTKIHSVNTNIQNVKNRNICIMLAGGKSTRNQHNIPNQFIDVYGKPIIMYALETYQNHPLITDIYIVCLKGWEKIVKTYIEKYNITKFRKIITGGPSGIESSKNAFNYIKDTLNNDDIIIFQEATRPLISNEMISNIIQSTLKNDYAVINEQMNDYLQFTTYDGIVKYIDRKNLISLQSPEAYKAHILHKAFKNKTKNETCCAMFIYNNGYKLNLVESNHLNLKITRQEDVAYLRSYIDINNRIEM